MPAAKKTTTATKKESVARPTKKPAAKKPAARSPAAKKPAARNPAAKKPVELKTKATTASVASFLDRQDAARRDDCKALDAMFRRATGKKAKLWGSSILGYGSHTLTYPNGRTLDWMLTGFSPRKQNLTLYVMGALEKRPDLVKKLGPCSTGKGCLYIKRLADVDQAVLEELVRTSVAVTQARA